MGNTEWNGLAVAMVTIYLSFILTGNGLQVEAVVSNNCVPCSIDACTMQICLAAPRAVCRPIDCGSCKATWFLDNAQVDCVTGKFVQNSQQINPIVSQQAPWQRTCAKGEFLAPCDMSVCDQKICRNFPNAVCRPDGCGGCKDTWYVDNTLVDCLSDECPPRVPVVKCVDDPCKYFGHYCPSAECRASQCGKCEAKFFSNGQEIDCAMPPRECDVSVKPRLCPWYTCPANICPSNKRLMCRINPCGNRCEYEFVDIYNGEILPCRVFDGDGTPRQTYDSAPEVTFTDASQIPSLSNMVPPMNSMDPSSPSAPEPEALGIALPKPVEISSSVPRQRQTKDDSVMNGGFNAEPIFLNQAPPIVDPDLLAILSSFAHEMLHIPSATIQTAIKKATGAKTPVLSQQVDILTPQDTARFNNVVRDVNTGSKQILLNPKPITKETINVVVKQPKEPYLGTAADVSGVGVQFPVDQNLPFTDGSTSVFQENIGLPSQVQDPFNQGPDMSGPLFPEQPMPEQLPTNNMKNLFNIPSNPIDTQLLDISKSENLFRDLPVETPVGPEVKLPSTNNKVFHDLPAENPVHHNPMQSSTGVDPLYPELTQIPKGPIAAGKPKVFDSTIMGQKRMPSGAKEVPKPAQPANGVPISMHMFSQWAAS
ncbi:hypothetical protein ACF0H5_024375 [Mactra antiquata]